jgi:hypothetical protein
LIFPGNLIMLGVIRLHNGTILASTEEKAD